jgi:outer membrane protein assembly factor BamE (lipoprotein component of BamABCDE complex)
MRLPSYMIIMVVLISFLSGCLVFGKNKEYQPFDSTELDKLVPGQSKASEVTEIFGSPTNVVKLANGNAYVYRRTITKGTMLWLILVTFGNADKQHDRLVFFFDLEDTLTHYGVSLNAAEAAYGLPTK